MTADRPIDRVASASVFVPRFLVAIALALLFSGCASLPKNVDREASVALAKELSHLPVIADPSHGTGKQSLIGPVARAAIALGADGIIVEVHPCPERALSDGPQSLDLMQFEKVMRGLGEPLRPLGAPGRDGAELVGRHGPHRVHSRAHHDVGSTGVRRVQRLGPRRPGVRVAVGEPVLHTVRRLADPAMLIEVSMTKIQSTGPEHHIDRRMIRDKGLVLQGLGHRVLM
jgi:hypothetical protein